MNPVVRRITTHTVLTGLFLAAVGLVLAQVASFWLAASPPPRGVRGEVIDTSASDAAFVATLRVNVPLYLALWGVALVAVGETGLHFWRKRKAPTATAARPDEAEALLEELLAQAEAARSASPDVGVQTPAPRVGALDLGAARPAERQDATK